MTDSFIALHIIQIESGVFKTVVKMNKKIEIGLCGPGRHEIKNNNGDEISDFIFEAMVEKPNDFEGHRLRVWEWLENNIEPLDEATYGPWGNDAKTELRVYLTGLTQCTTSLINAVVLWNMNSQWDKKILLTMLHFDRDTGGYKEEQFVTLE